MPSVVKAMRTAPMGPSKGMPESISAAEAPLMARTSWGFTRSAARMVPTTWTSLRKPSGKHGRSGRSMRRQVRMAWSGALPSRRKNEPGILPAAYMRSSMSTVSGKKSTPSRADLAAVAVTRTTVSPIWTSTAPSARPASLPVEKVRVLSGAPAIRASVEMASAMGCLLRVGPLGPVSWRRRHQFPVVSGRTIGSDAHHRQLRSLCRRCSNVLRPGRVGTSERATPRGRPSKSLASGAGRAWR